MEIKKTGRNFQVSLYHKIRSLESRDFERRTVGGLWPGGVYCVGEWGEYSAGHRRMRPSDWNDGGSLVGTIIALGIIACTCVPILRVTCNMHVTPCSCGNSGIRQGLRGRPRWEV